MVRAGRAASVRYASESRRDPARWMAFEVDEPPRGRSREIGSNGTYLFEFATQPGGPVGRSDTTAGSRPIPKLDRPRGERPARTMDVPSHLVPYPVRASEAEEKTRRPGASGEGPTPVRDVVNRAANAARTAPSSRARATRLGAAVASVAIAVLAQGVRADARGVSPEAARAPWTPRAQTPAANHDARSPRAAHARYNLGGQLESATGTRTVTGSPTVLTTEYVRDIRYL